MNRFPYYLLWSRQPKFKGTTYQEEWKITKGYRTICHIRCLFKAQNETYFILYLVARYSGQAQRA
jgi:hypothetical protein